LMRLVASTPTSKTVPEAVRGALEAISTAELREDVERIAVPRVYRTPENEAVRRIISDLFSHTVVERSGVEVDGAGNVVVGDPRRARTLIGAHYDAVPGTPGADDNSSASMPRRPAPDLRRRAPLPLVRGRRIVLIQEDAFRCMA
jgi:hypothetical protein